MTAVPAPLGQRLDLLDVRALLARRDRVMEAMEAAGDEIDRAGSRWPCCDRAWKAWDRLEAARDAIDAALVERGVTPPGWTDEALRGASR